MYTPSKKVLEKYADVLINFALWSGKGIKKGDTVTLLVSESAKPFLKPLILAVLKSGGHPVTKFFPEGLSRDFYNNASDEQIKYAPKNELLGRVKDTTHSVGVISTYDKHSLKGVDPKKIMLANKSRKFYMDARTDKENKGKLTWTLALYGTEAMAKEAGMSLKSYWDQIIKACYLDYSKPVKKWEQIYKKMYSYKNKLDKLKIEKLHVLGKDVDLEVKLGKGRIWKTGSGRNIPSFEHFISPDWRGTNGWIRFNQPLYRYGNLITGIELVFKNGKVIKSKARKNQKILREMIATKNADKIGEFSLTDKRFSRITKFMAETLYDENMGGKYGNTHLALGMSYKDNYPGDPSKVKRETWKKLGYNDSVVHTDIISTTDRTVTATLPGGKEKVIYKNGSFTL